MNRKYSCTYLPAQKTLPEVCCPKNPKPVAKPLPKVTVMNESVTPERQLHGRTDVLFEPPNPSKDDTRPLREKSLNKRTMDLMQKRGVIGIKGGCVQFGRPREGAIGVEKACKEKGDLGQSDQQRGQASAPSSSPPPPSSGDVLSGGGPSALAMPEFNTTLRLAERIRRVEQHQPDLDRMAELRLKECPCVAQEVKEKANSRLNYGRREFQFGNVIPVEVNESVLIGEIEARKQARVEALRPAARGARRQGPRPHLRDLMHLAVQYEFPVPPEPEHLVVRPPPVRPVGYDRLMRRATDRVRGKFVRRGPC